MAKSYTTMVGTVGTGIWMSNDGGERWTRCRGMWNETQVFALTPHPQDPQGDLCWRSRRYLPQR